MTTPRKPLTDILPGASGGNEDIFDRFDATEAADDFGPLPKGVYVALAVGGKLDQARTGTRHYTVEFKVIDGEHAGRRLWMSKYFTPDAMRFTKRDLAKLGIDTKAKLTAPFPANRMVCKLTVTVRKDDSGIERNEIKALELVRVQEPAADPFAPHGADETPNQGDDPDGVNGGPMP